MRLAFFVILGVFLWAGTVSIKYPQQSSRVTTSPGNTCSDQAYGDKLMTYLKIGAITSIHDNGRILTIGLSSQWSDLSPGIQQKTYETVVCYAQSQHRSFQLLATYQL
jgi:hypothetical protein